MAMSIRNLNNRRLKKATTEYHKYIIGTFRVGRFSVLGISAKKNQSGYRFTFNLEGYFTDDCGEVEVLKNQVPTDGEFVWVSEAGGSYPVPSNIIRYFMEVADRLA